MFHMKGKLLGIAGKMRTSVSVGLAALSVMAAGVPVFGNTSYTEPDPDTVFGSLTTTNTSVDNAGSTFLGIFRSSYTVVVIIGTVLIAIGIILAVTRMIISSNGNTRETAKNDLIKLIIGAIGLGAVLIIISLMLSIGGGFGN